MPKMKKWPKKRTENADEIGAKLNDDMAKSVESISYISIF